MTPEGSWQEVGKAARRARGVKLAQVLAIGAVALLGGTLFLRSLGADSGPVETGSTPGYDDREVEIDDSPFAPATPGNASASTTLVLPDPDQPSTSTTTPPPPPPPTTTTTQPIPTTSTTLTPLPSPGDDPVCQAVISLAEVFQDSPVTGTEDRFPPELADILRDAIGLVADTQIAAYRPLVDVVRKIADDIDDANTVDEQIVALQPLLAPTDPAVAAARDAVFDYTDRTCPGLTRTIEEGQ